MASDAPQTSAGSALKRAALWLAVGVGVCLFLLAGLAGLLALRPDLALGQAKSLLAQYGVELKWEKLEPDFAPPGLSARGLSLSGKEFSLKLDDLDCRTTWANLLGTGPLFNRVTLNGLDLAIKPSAGRGDQGASLDWVAWLLKSREIQASRVKVNLTLENRTLLIRDLALRISNTGKQTESLDLEGGVSLSDGAKDPLLSGRIKASGRVVSGPTIRAGLILRQARLKLPRLRGLLSLRAELDLSTDDLKFRSIRARLDQGQLMLEDTRLPVRPELEASGGVFLADGSMNWLIKKFSMPGMLELKGEMSGPTWQLMAGKLVCELQDLARIHRLVRPLLPPGLSPYAPAGDAGLSLELAGDGSYGLTISPRKAFLNGPGLKLSLGGAALLSGNLGGPPKLSGALKLSGGLKAGRTGLEGFALKLPLAGTLERPHSPHWELLLPAGGLSFAGRKLPLEQLRLGGDLQWSAQGLLLQELKLEAGDLGRLQGLASWGSAGWRSGMEGEIPSLDRLPQILSVLQPSLAGWSLKGSAALRVSLGEDKSGLKAEAEVRPKGLGLSSPSGSFLAGGAEGGFQLAAAWPSSGPARYRLAAHFEQGELLYNAWYLNLARSPLSFSGAGSPLGKGWRDLALVLKLDGLGRLDLKGDLGRSPQGWRPKLALRASQLALSRIYRDIAKDALSVSHPQWAGLDLGGKAGASLRLNPAGGEKLRLEGGVELEQVSLGSKGKPPWLKDLALSLPVSYVFGPGPPPHGQRPQTWGSLRIGSLRLPGLALDRVSLPLALAPNRLLTNGELELPLFGSTVRLSGLRVDDPLSRDFKASAEASLNKLDLARLPLPLKLKGELGGRLSPVVFNKDGLRAGGRLSGQLFGGKLSLAKLRANPFSPGKGFGGDLRLRNVDLLALTSALQAGVITGRADISLLGLRVDYGQPVDFELTVRSRPLGLTDQLVSLKAVNSISVMGTGAGLSGLGITVFKQFFSKFPYEKIGFRCRLKNDVFKVQGLIKQDGVEYLIKKPPLMGINVINQNPDNLIGFSDMLDRLKRVLDKPDQKSAAGQPVKE